MADFEKAFLKVSKMQDGVYAKALANYLFREIIEDAHEKYSISQADMEAMCRTAVNRAALFLDIQTHPELYDAFRAVRDCGAGVGCAGCYGGHGEDIETAPGDRRGIMISSKCACLR